MTVAAFRGRSRTTGSRSPARRREAPPPWAPMLASVGSPPLVEIAERMLQESNNLVAENLARHVAIALGMPPTLSGGAAAPSSTELRRLGVTTPIGLVNGERLVAVGRDRAADADPHAGCSPPARQSCAGRSPGFAWRASAARCTAAARLWRDQRHRQRHGARGVRTKTGTWPRSRRSRDSSTTVPATCCSSRSWHRRCESRIGCNRPPTRWTQRPRPGQVRCSWPRRLPLPSASTYVGL